MIPEVPADIQPGMSQLCFDVISIIFDCADAADAVRLAATCKSTRKLLWKPGMRRDAAQRYLHYFIKTGNSAGIQRVFGTGAVRPAEYCNYALKYAVAHGNTALAEFLILNYHSVILLPALARTLFPIAAMSGSVATVQILIKFYAPDAELEKKMCVTAINTGNFDVARLLIERNQRNPQNHYMITDFLHTIAASKYRDCELFESCVLAALKMKLEMEIGAAEWFGRLFMVTLRTGHCRYARFLAETLDIDFPATINEYGADSIVNCDTNTAHYLLKKIKKSIDVLASVVFEATLRDRTDIIRMFVHDPELSYALAERLPLCAAAADSKTEIVKELLKSPLVDPYAVNKYNQNAIDIAVDRNNPEILKILLQRMPERPRDRRGIRQNTGRTVTTRPFDDGDEYGTQDFDGEEVTATNYRSEMDF